VADDINSVHIIGRLTRDPQLRALPSGMSICDLGIALNERYKASGSEQWEERVHFIDVTVFGGQADACDQYLSKGRQVGIQGRLRYSTWEKDGQKRSKLDVVANKVQFLGSGDSNGSSRTVEPDIPIEAVAVPQTGFPDDDIPF
jgi:single-strand DNA-binding protein